MLSAAGSAGADAHKTETENAFIWHHTYFAHGACAAAWRGAGACFTGVAIRLPRAALIEPCSAWLTRGGTWQEAQGAGVGEKTKCDMYESPAWPFELSD